MPIKSTLTYLSLLTGSILTLAASPAQAAVLEFSTDGIKFDRDTTSGFIDFNDFKVSISTDKATTSIPEPAAIAGLMLVGGIMLTTRLR
ncbi:PEP-CTERM sorting domain-containing protein [Floridanema evergladense]|uniref:PEP-CTERM sorting domain-containing protein n=1 Tax=Floridaenema evergladense BLCC-F167 TaxID=3153639 RepID=A0ABV4WQL8_9CYAN